MPHRLLIVTYVLLTLLIALTAALHRFINWDGFFLNLSTELLGILVTVAIVDQLLRRHEAARWQPTDERVRNRLEVFVNVLVSELRSSLGFGLDVLDERIMRTNDPRAMHRELLRVATHVLEPAVHQRLEGLGPEQWKRFASSVQRIGQHAGHLLPTFQHRLSPERQELLLDIEDAAHRALTFYTTFPDLAGVSPERLPETRTPAEILQAHGYESTANEIRTLLRLAVKLSGA